MENLRSLENELNQLFEIIHDDGEASVIGRLQTLQKELQNLRQDALEVATTKRELAAACVALGMDEHNRSALTVLASAPQVNLAPSTVTRTLKLQKEVAPSFNAGPQVAQRSFVPSSSIATNSASMQPESKSKNEKRKRQDALQEWALLDAEAFEDLPKSVRGRAMLADVQSALQTILAYFKTEADKLFKKNRKRRREALQTMRVEVKDLERAGAKLSGHTGRSVLLSLRALGKVELGGANRVRLVEDSKVSGLI